MHYKKVGNMLFRRIFILIFCLSLIGCVAATPRVGSDGWHEKRIIEIEEAYKAGDIDKAQYLQLKNEADQINIQYRYRDRYGYAGYGSYHHRGGIGVGVGF